MEDLAGKRETLKDLVERELLADPAGSSVVEDAIPRFSQVTHIQESSEVAEAAPSAELEEEIRQFAERLAELKTLEPVE